MGHLQKTPNGGKSFRSAGQLSGKNDMAEENGGTRAPIVEVALNVPLRRVFDYLLPPELMGQVTPGWRVVVPFGRRVMAGVVVGLKAQSDLAPGRLRPVGQASGDGAMFSAEMLAFTQWVAGYYFCGWGEVLEAALPAGLGARIDTRYRWRAGLDAETRAAAAQALPPGMASWVLERGEWEAPAWRGLCRQAEDSALAERWLARQLRAGGTLERIHSYAGTRTRPRMERWVQLEEAGRAFKARRGPGGKHTHKGRVLELLRDGDGAMPVAALKAYMPDPGTVLRGMAKEGLVTLAERAQDASQADAGASQAGGVAGGAASPAGSGGDTGGAPTGEHGGGTQGAFLALNPDQAIAHAAIAAAIEAGKEGGAYHGFLLEGVTGSGKTEVYLHAVRDALALGKTALVLVPEIALTASMTARFHQRFPGQVAVLHSGLGDRERFEGWNRVWRGEASIVIGARSALFAPLDNLGLVVVDEEHDGSYKQDEAPRYNGRDAALMRASRAGAVAVLGSATPSIESLRNVELGKLTRLHLPARVEARPLPPVELLDMATVPRQKGCWYFSRPLTDALRETLKQGEQAILFLNRRGYSALVRCGACGEALTCGQCSITLTYHQSREAALCHRCDFRMPVPETCPHCEMPELERVGLGTERLEEEVNRIFPRARVLRMDSDTLRRRGELDRRLADIAQRKCDIIIGTQVLTKGHDFPHITLVGAVLADTSLNLPDFRAPERTFQLLTQMAGRAGRGARPGRVIIQTYNPTHYSLTHVRGHDVAGFTEAERAIRMATGSPPYSAQALLWLSAPREGDARGLAEAVGRRLEACLQEGTRMLGPDEAPIRRLQGRYRQMILLRAPTNAPIQHSLRAALGAQAPGGPPRLPPGGRIAVDIDPYNLL